MYSNDNSDTVINDDDIKFQKEEIKINADNNKMFIEEEQKDAKEEEKNEKSSATEIDLSGEKMKNLSLMSNFGIYDKLVHGMFIQ